MTALPERILSGEVEAPDVFCGGTPCQAFSVAGLRNSLDDARGNLSLTFVGIANAIDKVRSVQQSNPCIVFWENVPGVLSTKDNAFGCFLAGLAGEDKPLEPPRGKWTNAGYVLGPKRAVAWRLLDAQYFGVAQRRKRVFVVASARADFDPAAVLFEFDGVRRDTAPSREAWKESAGGTGASAANRVWPAEISSTLDTTFGTKQGLEDQHVNAGCPLFVLGTVQTLRTRRPGEGGMSADHEHLVPIISPALNTCSGSHHAPDTKAYVVHGTQDPCVSDIAFAQGRNNGGENVLMQPIPINSMNALRGADADPTTGCGIGAAGEAMFTITKGHSHAVAAPPAMQVRRLTPVECERLQGFPDNYTNIPWRKKDESPDGPRYKALGNSWAVPNVRWIGERIAKAA
jgi:DNA (cytosine-5)-methyltransferase 1